MTLKEALFHLNQLKDRLNITPVLSELIAKQQSAVLREDMIAAKEQAVQEVEALELAIESLMREWAREQPEIDY